MSRLPPPPPPVGHGAANGHPPFDRAPGAYGPGPHSPAGPFAPGGYPPPTPAGVAPTGSASLGIAPPSFAPKLRVRKTPEMLGYRSVDTIGTIVTAILAVWVPLSLYTVKLSLDYRKLVHEYGMAIPFDLEHPLDTRINMVNGASVLLLLVGGPLFLIWFARAYGNLPTISPGKTQSGTTKATLMWILPIVSLIRPFGYMKELWTRTDRIAGKAKPPTLIFVYWISFVASYVLQVLVAVGLVRGTANSDDLEFSADLTVLAAANAVLCAALLSVIVWQLSRRMTMRCAEVTNAVLSAPQH